MKIDTKKMTLEALDTLTKTLEAAGFYGEGTLTLKSMDGTIQKDITWTATKKTRVTLPKEKPTCATQEPTQKSPEN